MEVLGLAVPGGGPVASGGKVKAVIMGLLCWAEQEAHRRIYLYS